MSEQSITKMVKKAVASGEFGPAYDWEDGKITNVQKIDKASGRPVSSQQITLFGIASKPLTVRVETLNSTPSNAVDGDDVDLPGLSVSFYVSGNKVCATFSCDQIKLAGSSPSKPSEPRPAA